MKDFAYDLNMLLDNGETLSVDEVKERIENGTLFDWLVEIYPRDKYETEFESLLLEHKKDRLLNELFNSQRGVGNTIKNNGICYLLALALM